MSLDAIVRERRIVTIRDERDKPVSAGRPTKGEGPRARADEIPDPSPDPHVGTGKGVAP